MTHDNNIPFSIQDNDDEENYSPEESPGKEEMDNLENEEEKEDEYDDYNYEK